MWRKINQNLRFPNPAYVVIENTWKKPIQWLSIDILFKNKKVDKNVSIAYASIAGNSIWAIQSINNPELFLATWSNQVSYDVWRINPKEYYLWAFILDNPAEIKIETRWIGYIEQKTIYPDCSSHKKITKKLLNKNLYWWEWVTYFSDECEEWPNGYPLCTFSSRSDVFRISEVWWTGDFYLGEQIDGTRNIDFDNRAFEVWLE